MKEYEQYYFAFLDLLGFKDIVSTKTCDEIAEIFEEAKKRFSIRQIFDEDNTYVHLVPPEAIHYYVMSDSVCIFIKCDNGFALPVLVWLCLDFQVRLLCLKTPILVRGSISRGDLFVNENILFGPAMVEAYQREEALAIYPRIIIPTQLYNETTGKSEKGLLKGLTCLENDGFYVTNYIYYFCNHNSTLEYRENVINYLEKMINSTLSQSVREKCFYLKYWIDHYINDDKSP